MHKQTLTIGIPAFNEESNIGFLITDLFNQRTENVALEKIIIVSDGSTDNTIAIVKKNKDKRLKLVDRKERKGMSERENEIIKMTSSDILILLNADIRITDSNFLEKLTRPIRLHQANLVSCATKETKPKEFFEKVIYTSSMLKTKLYEALRNGENVYTCHGQARAFSKKMYATFRFPYSIGEDAYSYFYAISHKLKYAYVKDTHIFYQLPSNYEDHRKQSVRFANSKKLMEKEFGEKLVQAEYAIPFTMFLKEMIKMSIFHPIELISFIGIVGYVGATARVGTQPKNTWSMAKSSKKVTI